MKNKKKKIIIAAIVIVLILCVGVGAWFLGKGSGTVTEPGLDSLEEDAGNVPDDNWTARY